MAWPKHFQVSLNQLSLLQYVCEVRKAVTRNRSIISRSRFEDYTCQKPSKQNDRTSAVLHSNHQTHRRGKGKDMHTSLYCTILSKKVEN